MFHVTNVNKGETILEAQCTVANWEIFRRQGRENTVEGQVFGDGFQTIKIFYNKTINNLESNIKKAATGSEERSLQ